MKEEICVKLPQLGESIVYATVVRWLYKEGDFVSLDAPLLEVSTDKVNSEIPAPRAGILKKIVAAQGQEVSVGDILAFLEPEKAQECPLKEPSLVRGSLRSALSPAVLHLMKERGLSQADIESIEGSGEGGRITRQDIERWQPSQPLPLHPWTPLRKEIIRQMEASNHVPQAYLVKEIDFTALLAVYQKYKVLWAQKDVKLSVTSLFCYAIFLALHDFPHLNASYNPQGLLLHDEVNLAIATDVKGGVMMPVLRARESESLLSLSKSLSDLVRLAREGALQSHHVQGATISLTNFGMQGVEIGIPLLRPPEVAIIALGALRLTPFWEEGGSVGWRQIARVTLGFDHRVVDGAYGSAFLAALAEKMGSASTWIGENL